MRGSFHTFILNRTFAQMNHVTTFVQSVVLLLLVGMGVWQPAAAQTTYPYLSHEVFATSTYGTTYRVYVNFQNANDRVGAVFAQTNMSTGVIDELSIATTTSFYQNSTAGIVNFGDQVSTFLLPLVPGLQYDSWFTIGVSNSSEGVLGTIAGMTTALATFNTGSGFTLNDGTWTVTGANQLSTAPAFCVAGSDLKVLLGQFTVTNAAGGGAGHLSLNFNVQWFPHNAGIGGEVRTFDLAINTASGAGVPGCTTPTACNFNPAATTNNGSCIVPGPCDSCSGGALVDGDADNDGVCNANEVAGCTVSTACNYNVLATENNGSCVFAFGCDSCAGGAVVDGDADNDGVCNANEVPGCTISTACNYNSAATDNNGSCLVATGCDYCSGGAVVDGDTDNDGVCNANEIAGCTTVGACNYNAAATNNNGSCVFATGCDSCFGGAVVDGDTDNDGVCNVNEIPGCTVSTACNYNAAATDNNGSCVSASGCDTCGGGAVVDGDADNDGVCNANEIAGCKIATACNYNAAATDTNNSLCIYATGCDSCSGGAVVDGDADNDGVCNANEVAGCKIASACNYNAAATDTNNSLCVYATGCDTCGGGAVIDGDSDNDGVCNGSEVPGCMDSSACNYNSAATDSNGSCTFASAGYTCAGTCVTDTDGDGVCNAFEVAGCTVVTACNYNAAATDANNATCIYPPAGGNCAGTCTGDWDGDGVCNNVEIAGCMSSSATNYNPAATDDNGSCVWTFAPFQGLTYERIAVNGVAGTSTYRVYAEFTSNAVQVIAAYGSKNLGAVPPVNEPWSISSTEPFYQNPAGSLLSDNIIPSLYPIVPGLQFDTWLALGGTPGVPSSVSLIQPPSNPFNAFASTGGNVLVDDPVGATLYYLPGSSPSAYPVGGKLLIGQFTTGGVVSLRYNFQMSLNNITYRITDVELQFPEQGPGCMDATACNFDPAATQDDGSCLYPSTTCRNCSEACVLDVNADGVCDCEVVLGCIDAAAANFNASANTDNGSCLYAGCQVDFTACNYDPTSDLDDPTLCQYPAPFCDCDGDCAVGDYEGDGVQEVNEVEGCTSASATNFNSAATNDDGSCIWSPDLFQGLTYDVTLNSVPGFTTYRVYATFSGAAEVIALFGGQTPTGGGAGYPWRLQTTGQFYQNTAAGAGTANLVNPLLYPFFPGLQYDSWFTIGSEPGEPTDLAVAYMSGPTGALAQWNTSGTFSTNSGAVFVTPGSALDQGATDAEGRVLIGQFTTNGVGYGIFNLQYLDGSGNPHIVYDVEIIFPPMSPGCQDPTSLTYDADSNFPDPSLCVFPGCTDPDACNYDDDANLENGSCILPTGCETCSGATDGTGTVVDNDADNDGVCNADEIAGCQVSTACNYNAAATDPGVSCIYAIAANCEACSGATNGTGTVVDQDADNDGICNANEIPGCQTPSACNYNAAATDPGVTCAFAVAANCEACSGATNGTGTVLDLDADNDGVCNANEIPGCQVSTACNYNAAATDPGVTCTFAVAANCQACSGATNGTGIILDLDADNDGVCDANEIVGCQTVGATNYNPLATDPGPCPGCTNPAADNYNALNDVSNGTCVLGGCMYEAATNYEEEATYDIGNCEFAYAGCTNSSSPNFNPLAVIDDGSCLVVGCMDPDGLNFNPAATFSGGCDYPDPCPGDLNGDGNITVEDLLNLFQVYGTSCPD